MPRTHQRLDLWVNRSESTGARSACRGLPSMPAPSGVLSQSVPIGVRERCASPLFPAIGLATMPSVKVSSDSEIQSKMRCPNRK